MAFSTTVSQRKHIKRKAPRGFLKRVFKRQKPHLRLETRGDLLVRSCPFFGWEWSKRDVEEINPSFYFATPSKSSSVKPTSKAFPAVTRQVCPRLTGQFIFLPLSCLGPSEMWVSGPFLREAISHIILRGKVTLSSCL